MILELIIALTVGICIGTFTGLLPGLHINLVSTILLASSPILLAITSPISLVVFIVALSITHTFVDFIPSIFLGAPNEDTALSILPGHQMLLEGKGFEAVIITLYGCLASIPIIFILTPIFIFSLSKIYPYVLRIMPLILILISFYLIITEKKKLIALLIFILSGFLGIAVLNISIDEPLLPLFSGLFGASGLFLSINQKTKIPVQEIKKIKHIRLEKESFSKSMISSILTSPFTSFLPGLGSSQSALIATQISGKTSEKEFLFIIGIINPIVMALSFVTLYSINKTRTGAAVAVSKLIPKLTIQELIIILTVITLTSIIVFIISINLAKFFSIYIYKIDYSKLSILILVFLISFIIYFSGFIGLLVFFISANLGIFCILSGIKRTELMGCLLIPTILYYL
ncbi:MAG: tripartite tricarboxylate transporter permease [Nanoarchaeota archaeon]|nr:tripartite tricarboxylate transporter permease [Nanoarchaeota archaeon]